MPAEGLCFRGLDDSRKHNQGYVEPHTGPAAGARMLVLVSDLHITDSTTANNVNPEAFDLLGAEIADAASRAAPAKSTWSCWATFWTWCEPTTGIARPSPWPSARGVGHSTRGPA